MTPNLNLATQPFVNRRQFYVLTSITTIALSLILAALVTTYVHNFRSQRGIRQKMSTVRDEIGRLEVQQKKLEDDLSQPAAADVLDRTDFLNALIRQKSISWTRIFMDLEKIMPDRVEATSLRPVVILPGSTGKGKSRVIVPLNGGLMVDLQMTVLAETFPSALDLVKRMEQSQNFKDPRLYVENPPAATAKDTDRFYGLQLSVNYVQ